MIYARNFRFWGLTVILILSATLFFGIVRSGNPFMWGVLPYAGSITLATQGFLIIWMIKDCIRRRFPNDATKIGWLAAIAFTAPLGTTLYYSMVVRKENRKTG